MLLLLANDGLHCAEQRDASSWRLQHVPHKVSMLVKHGISLSAVPVAAHPKLPGSRFCADSQLCWPACLPC